MRYPRSLVLLGSLAALVCAPAGPAFSASATLSGQAMPSGFARLSLAFDEATPLKVRVANGVLSVAFASPVTVDVAAVTKQLPDWITLARVDPDRRGMRFALARPFRANLIEAGDKAFIDLLPENWRGLMPGPPPEVVADLAERLRRAEAKAKDVAARPAEPLRALAIRITRLPTLDRLTAALPPGVASEEKLENGRLTLRFDKQFAVDQPQLRRSLPEGFALASAETGPTGTTLVVTIPQDRSLRSFREDDAVVVDLARPVKPEPAAVAQPAPAEPAAAPVPKPELAAAGQPAQPAPPPAAPEQPAAPVQPMSVAVTGSDKSARVEFRFPRPTGAAAFTDAGTLTLVFDTRETLDPAWFGGLPRKLVEETTVAREGRAVSVRLKLAGPQLARLAGEGPNWTLLFGEQGGKPAESVLPRRGVDERGQTVVEAGMPGLTGVHWLERGPGGLPVAVATALAPVRTVAKPYRFVDFALLQTAQGLAVSPRADDVLVRAGTDKALIGRTAGLTVTLDPEGERRAEPEGAPAQAPIVDTALWSELRSGTLRDRERALLRDVAEASRSRKSMTRLALARFYVANELMPEAAGPLKTLLQDDPVLREAREPLFLLGAIAAGLHRDPEALRVFGAAPIREDAEIGLWRALVEQRLGQHAKALIGFRRGGAILDRYPKHIQARMRVAKVRAALAVQDLTVAGQELQTLSELPAGLVEADELDLLQSMQDDGSGRPEAAIAGYRKLFDSRLRPVAAEAQLRAVRLAQTEKRPEFSQDEAIARLETVSVIWRGGDTEIEALSELGRLYAEQKRWREAFMVARRANENFPENPLTRRLHDETAQRFADLFGGGDESLPRIEALALFYDFKEFLPIGRRGDEITRLLADRLVELDLLDSAADILRYQMEKRLQGAARSIAAARLAMVSLMAGKPADALQALTTTRLVELPADVRRARLLLEAKALSDLSRTDQALEMLDGEHGNEIDRLRADIFWTGKRWREAGEEQERILGESWRAPSPLTEAQRTDVMRAAIAYVLADEALSLDRLRTKYAARMADSPDARTFAFVTSANRSRSGDMREIARAAAGAGNVTDFLNAYRERYPAFSTAVRNPAPQPGPQAGERRAATPGGAAPG